MSGFNTQYISTKNLCTGRYEFWLVVRTRNGSILQYVKPFFSKYPTCKDYNIDPKYNENYANNAIFAREKRVFELVDESNDYLITQKELDDFIEFKREKYKDIVLDSDLKLMQDLLDISSDEYCSYDKFAYNPNKIRFFYDQNGNMIDYPLVN